MCLSLGWLPLLECGLGVRCDLIMELVVLFAKLAVLCLPFLTGWGCSFSLSAFFLAFISRMVSYASFKYLVKHPLSSTMIAVPRATLICADCWLSASLRCSACSTSLYNSANLSSKSSASCLLYAFLSFF